MVAEQNLCEDKLIRDVQPARKQEARARARDCIGRRTIVTMPPAIEERKTIKEREPFTSIIPAAFRRRGRSARQTGIREARQPAAALASLIRAQ